MICDDCKKRLPALLECCLDMVAHMEKLSALVDKPNEELDIMLQDARKDVERLRDAMRSDEAGELHPSSHKRPPGQEGVPDGHGTVFESKELADSALQVSSNWPDSIAAAQSNDLGEGWSVYGWTNGEAYALCQDGTFRSCEDGTDRAPTEDCWCHKCDKPRSRKRMVLCPACGNKRCPRASDHEMECTGSNESGQKGSVYE